MMKEAVLLVAHGTRDPGNEGNREVEELAEIWRSRHPTMDIQLCWIEHAPVLLEEGMDRAAAGLSDAGGRLLVLPLVLNAAGHAKSDIPQAIETAQARYPNVEFRYGHHLGTTDQLLKALRYRLHQAMVELAMPDPRTTGVVLLARGASDIEATGEVAKMAHWIYETTRHDLVLPAFTSACFPRLEQVVQRLDLLGEPRMRMRASKRRRGIIAPSACCSPSGRRAGSATISWPRVGTESRPCWLSTRQAGRAKRRSCAVCLRAFGRSAALQRSAIRP